MSLQIRANKMVKRTNQETLRTSVSKTLVKLNLNRWENVQKAGTTVVVRHKIYYEVMNLCICEVLLNGNILID
jgi:hypothetical protein